MAYLILVVPYGGHHGTVTGGSFVAHVGTNRWPWPRLSSSVGVAP